MCFDIFAFFILPIFRILERKKQKIQTPTADCENCTPGSFCDGIDPSDVTGVCEAGFYCPGGSTKASDVICTIGSYCTEGK